MLESLTFFVLIGSTNAPDIHSWSHRKDFVTNYQTHRIDRDYVPLIELEMKRFLRGTLPKRYIYPDNNTEPPKCKKCEASL